MPKSVTKINKNGVNFIDSVDATLYTIEELSRAALRDTGKLLVKGIKKNVPVKTGTLKKNIAAWNRKSKNGEDPSLHIGVYSAKKAKEKGLTPARHAHLVQFGARGGDMPAQPFLDTTTYSNIDTIRKIHAQYLSAVGDGGEAESLIDEGAEEVGE